ncbi:MAG TPA: TRIC cation channel family protein [Burkholderiales bacterium]|nr:TRIC cation channel family protein [Burkholderiales bacterium]
MGDAAVETIEGTFGPLLVLSLDMMGTFAFAVSGASAGVKRELDLFGVLLLSFAAAAAGGIARDVLIGAVPPAALSDWRYLATALAAGAITFWWHPLVDRLRNPVQLFDAAGLALFAVAGAEKALAHGLSPLMAALLGMLTGIGGGIVRDVLLAGVPSVLRSELYAVAALAGAAVVVTGHVLQVHAALMAALGAVLCFVLRLLAIRYRIGPPVARVMPPKDS